MLSGEKILITGPAGQIAYPLARYLAQRNEVWGLARFTDADSRARVEDIGVTTVAGDVADGVPAELPSDFSYVLHLAVFSAPRPDYDHAMRVNAEGTGLLLHHCRRAKAALVMSTHAVYRPHADPWYAYRETDPLGDAMPPYSPTYSITKIAQEAVARYCARAYDLPVVIARMNASYGANGGLPLRHAERIRNDLPVIVKADPLPYSPIHQDDINRQSEMLLEAAGVPALIVNWGGDEPISAREWCESIAAFFGKRVTFELQEVAGSQIGLVADERRREAITGRCTILWRNGLADALRARHSDYALERS